MSSQEGSNNIFSSDNDEINLKNLFFLFWNQKFLIIFITTIAAVSSVLYSISIPNIYRSQALIMPIEKNKNMSSLGGLSSLAGMAGIALPGASSSRKDEALAILNTHQFLENFIIKHDLLVPLMASNGWDKDTNMLLINPKAYDQTNNKWVTKNPNKEAKPSMQQAVKKFREIAAAKLDKKSGYVTVHVDSYSPQIAKEWVDLLIKDINTYMRMDEVSRSMKSLEYLNNQVSKTSITEIKNVLSELIKSETQTIMLSKSSPEYMFKTIDGALVPEFKLGPKRSIICIVGTILGGFLALLIALIRYFYRQTKLPL
jgi:uncharacterized protein involved in exopolysaccharide biosynthesis